MDSSKSQSVVKADDILHVLRDALVIMPGSRDKEGRTLLILRPRETASADHLRNVFLYMHNVARDSDRGFTAVLDLRGKKWDTARPMLKALSHVSERHNMHIQLLLIVKPDSFWEKQKSQFSNIPLKAEVQQVSIESLTKFIDTSSIPRDLGGSLSFDYDEWLETRLELEGWVWKVSEWMRILEDSKKKMVNATSATCVQSAEEALRVHSHIQKCILSVPVDEVEREAVRIADRIKRGEQREADLDASLPHLSNAVASLIALKKEAFDSWQKRRQELGEVHERKLAERDAEGVLSWLKSRADYMEREMKEMSEGVEEMESKLREVDDLMDSLRHADVNVDGVMMAGSRIKSGSRNVNKVAEEHSRLGELLVKRRHLLSCAIAFERAEEEYVRDWSEWKGLRPHELSSRDPATVQEALSSNEQLWQAADSAWLNAMEKGQKLSSACNAIDCVNGERRTKERIKRLAADKRHIEAEYKDCKKSLSMLNAFDAFQQDMARVFDWLDTHGEPYLRKNTGIGEDMSQASHLRHNHMQFREIAKGTYENAKKLFEVGNDCIQSRLFNDEAIRLLLSQLDQRIVSFENRVESRLQMLNQATLFFTHHQELLKWYDQMMSKYTNVSIHTSTSQCEHDNKQWSLESDGTAQAYTTTVAEGMQLVKAMESSCNKEVVQKIYHMLGDIDERNSQLMLLWQQQRPALQFGLKFAILVNDMQDLLEQLSSWEKDMHSLVRSEAFLDNAPAVYPYHSDNQVKVRKAIDNIKSVAVELTQIAKGHGLEELKTVEGEGVVEVIRTLCLQLDHRDIKVMRTAVETSRRLDGAAKALAFRDFCNELIEACAICEKKIDGLSCNMPTNLNDAMRMASELTDCQREFEAREKERAHEYTTRLDEVLKKAAFDRQKILDWNQEVNRSLGRLNLFISDKHRALKSATDFYKTYSNVLPILTHLEKEYTKDNQSDPCSSLSNKTCEEKVEQLAQLLSHHLGVRERFQKGCTYAHKTSEIFLRYIQRGTNSVQYRECTLHVQTMRNTVREQQARILELWAKKKKELDRCQQFQLLELSRNQLTEWLKGEGKKELEGVKSLNGQERKDRLAAFLLLMKEKRMDVQAMLHTGDTMREESEKHAKDIEHTLGLMRQAYDAVVEEVTQLEASRSHEISLYRQSDPNVSSKLEDSKREAMKGTSEAMRELLHTERVYIDDLKRTIDVYVEAFDRMDSEGQLPPLLKGHRTEIFGNIEDIYTFHSTIFMKELQKYEKEIELVGYSFVVYVSTLSELYTAYCAHKDLNKKILHLPESVQFFESIRDAHSLDSSNSLDSLLIKPVQRVTRYALLMGQLCKKAAGEGVKDALQVVNNIPKKANDICHLNYIDSKDKEKLTNVGPLVTQDTLMVWESRSLIKGKGKERQVFLFELALALTKRVTEGNNNTNIRYFLKGKHITLSEISSVVEHVEGGDPCRFALRLGEFGANENRLELRASSENAKISWIKKLRECIHSQEMVSLKLGLDMSRGVNWLADEDSSSTWTDDTKRNSMQSTSSAETEKREEGSQGWNKELEADDDIQDVNPDRPSLSSPQPQQGTTTKRKSLRRIFSQSRQSTSPDTRNILDSTEIPSSSSSTVAGVLSCVDLEKETIASGIGEEGLPPPMEEMSGEKGEEVVVEEEKSEEKTDKKDDKTPEEMARFKRQYVLMELVETEKDYIKDLGSVVEGYMAEMQEKDLPEDLQGKDKIIFANIAQIHEFHKSCFLKDIERSLEDYNASASAFVKYERRLHTLYVKYCQNKPKSDFLVGQEAFEQYFAETKARLGHKIALCDLLIKPVQRIMKYQLLLKDILKFTERASDNTDVLKKALQVMHVVPKACDDMMQVGRLQNFDGNLNAQGKLLHQGTVLLSEQGGGGASGSTAKSKERRIFLFEQSAIIADCIMPKKEFSNPTYIFKNQIMVNKLVLDPNVADSPVSFIIRSSDSPTSFLAQCQSEEEKQEWVMKLNLVLDQQKTLLAALVDPKRYQSQLAGGMASVSMDEGEKKKTGSSSIFSRLKSAPSASSTSSPSPSSTKADSPKHSSSKTKTSLFNFGKKTSKNSAPVVGK